MAEWAVDGNLQNTKMEWAQMWTESTLQESAVVPRMRVVPLVRKSHQLEVHQKLIQVGMCRANTCAIVW